MSTRSQVPGKAITITVKVPPGVTNVRIRIVCPTLGTTEIIIGGVKEVTLPVGADGTIKMNFSAPRSCHCHIEVFDAATGKQIGGQIPVDFVAADNRGGGLPMTGADVGPIALGAGVLLAGGATAVGVSRKRR